jgi:hypothetical protein
MMGLSSRRLYKLRLPPPHRRVLIYVMRVCGWRTVISLTVIADKTGGGVWELPLRRRRWWRMGR